MAANNSCATLKQEAAAAAAATAADIDRNTGLLTAREKLTETATVKSG